MLAGGKRKDEELRETFMEVARHSAGRKARLSGTVETIA